MIPDFSLTNRRVIARHGGQLGTISSVGWGFVFIRFDETPDAEPTRVLWRDFAAMWGYALLEPGDEAPPVVSCLAFKARRAARDAARAVPVTRHGGGGSAA